VKLFISPHNDDETLFGAFTILREHPAVLIVTDSQRQEARGISAIERKRETLQALMWLQPTEVHFLHIPDAELSAETFSPAMDRFLREHGPFEHFYVPAFEEGGNVDHNLIASSLTFANKSMVTEYLTYTTAGKSRSQNMVPFEKDWPLLKMQALACYRSQILEPSTRDHFLREQYEYYA
jgi:hypothetical protein